MKNPLIKDKLNKFNMHYYHPPHILERRLLAAIKNGQLSEAMTALNQIYSLDAPRLAKSDLRSKKNALIAACTVYTRAAIDGGVFEVDAFDLSDICINHIETLNTLKELTAFQYEMLTDFIRLVNENAIDEHSYPITKVTKYIYEHITAKISTSSLAEMVHLSPDYLSKLFHEEMGLPLTEFVQTQKIEVAKNFLEFTEMHITEIAALLTFCNSAYFSSVFKKHTGQSPKDYRNKYKKF